MKKREMNAGSQVTFWFIHSMAPDPGMVSLMVKGFFFPHVK